MTSLLEQVREKFAARAGVRQLRSLYEQVRRAAPEAQHGLMQQIQGLESRAGDILHGRTLPLGARLSILGGGSEGVAQHVLTPQGSRVSKMYDPYALAHNPIVTRARTQMIGHQDPNIAEIFAHQRMKHVLDRPGEAHLLEYVHGTMPKRLSPKLREVAETGHAGNMFLDVRPANVVQTPKGVQKIVDPMPFPREHTRTGLRPAQKGRLTDEVDWYTPSADAFAINREDPNRLRHLSINPSMESRLAKLIRSKSPHAARAEQLLEQAERHYQGQVLRANYTGQAPSPFIIRGKNPLAVPTRTPMKSPRRPATPTDRIPTIPDIQPRVQ